MLVVRVVFALFDYFGFAGACPILLFSFIFFRNVVF